MKSKFNSTYDCIVVLNCLSLADDHLLQNLAFDDLLESFEQNDCRNCLKEHLTITVDAFLKELETLKYKAATGLKFLIHVFSHGNEDGIFFSETNEFLKWEEFASLLSCISANRNQKLILNMTSCKGFNATRINDFKGISKISVIGSPRDLYHDEVKEINRLFYSLLETNKEINVIVKAIQEKMNDSQIIRFAS